MNFFMILDKKILKEEIGIHELEYDENVWEEFIVKPVKTLQLFITNQCNLRCRACFYAHKLGREEMSFDEYKSHVLKYNEEVEKIILLGGEPTLHSNLEKIFEFNKDNDLRTTIYSNGTKLKMLENIDLSEVSVRIGVMGARSSEKPLNNVERVKIPVTIVFMLRPDNVDELMTTAIMAEKEFNCERFMISSIRDVAQTRNYWKDNENTIPLKEYAKIVQGFVNDYKGGLNELHLSNRGVIYGKKQGIIVDKCRFGNVFPDGKKIICPFDISLKKYTNKLIFNERNCNKNNACLLTKTVLRRK